MAPCFSVLSSEAGGQFFFTLETRIFKPVVFDRFQTDADKPREFRIQQTNED
jgi:hypothetical protein